ncbi:MAG TPA: hypothetical protein VNU68_15150 [Verrucomicrobiae bacterium]|nr:hypothetical protein [Verrucomicrobiae bacterium]
MSAGTEIYGSGTIPKIGDTKRMLMVKELQSTNNSSGNTPVTIQACLVAQSGGPVAACAYDFGLGYDNDSASPTAGAFWYWSKNDQAWIQFDV